MTKNNKIKVYVAMFFAVVFWGFSFVWTKQVLEVYRPITVIFLRLILSVLFLFGLGSLFNKIQKIKKEDRLRMVYIAFFQPFVYFIGENFGLSHVSSTIAAVMISTIPLFSIIVAYFVTNERISFGNFLGILLSVVGVFFVIMKKNMEFKADLLGIGFLLLAVFSAVGYSVIVVDVTKKYNVYSIIAYQNLIGIFMFAPLFFILDFKNFMSVAFTWKAWFPLIELAVFASTLAFMLFTFGIKNLGITKANTLSNLIPIVTAFFSFLVLGERFSFMNILGIFIVVLGLILSQIKRKSKNIILNEY